YAGCPARVVAVPARRPPVREEVARFGLGLRLRNAGEALTGDVDVQWGIWLRGGPFDTCTVVCCSPNRDAVYRRVAS
ncbi:hypothetical protein, partial [Microbispora sp. NPDC049633]|uniref:hypothetical protein n=1 Tax=Microbispora sp. NPDC049633 TaxID=3154355 RepID=UPI00344546AD